MIIAGIPIATVASAIARASIMSIPLVSASSSTIRRELEKPSSQWLSTAPLLQAYFARKGFGFAVCGNNRASVSRFVAGIGQTAGSTARRIPAAGRAPRHSRSRAATPSAMSNRTARTSGTQEVKSLMIVWNDWVSHFSLSD
jgi:hypothetical protein